MGKDGKRKTARRCVGQLGRWIFLMVLLACIVCAALLALRLTGHEYVLTEGIRLETIRLHPGTIEEACEKAGFDGLIIHEQREEGGTTYLTLGELLQAEISRGEEIIHASFAPCTVEQLLTDNGITLRDDEIVHPALYVKLTQDASVTIRTVTTEIVLEEEEIDFAIETRENSEMAKGERRIVQNGEKGSRGSVYQVVYENGRETNRHLLSGTIVSEPINCIIERGTGEAVGGRERPQVSWNEGILYPSDGDSQTNKGTGNLSIAGKEGIWLAPTQVSVDSNAREIRTPDGRTYRYSEVLSVRATAYHRLEEGGLITASGTVTQYGTVAVDPSVIPLGTRVFVIADDGRRWSYGPGLAEDTGGLIKGNRIDLFFMTGAEADTFGVRNAKIYILED